VWKLAVQSRMCWRLPRACATACNWVSIARAALITRGLAEMTRLGVALGARADTFMGLSGLGDLVLTATGDLSRNRKVGLLLARGQSLQEAVASFRSCGRGGLFRPNCGAAGPGSGRGDANC